MYNKEVRVLITVGTTEFDDLIKYTSSQSFLKLLYSVFPLHTLTYQIGQTGKIVPEVGPHLRLSEKIQDIYDEHQIIISHGGAGTLLYLLANPKPGRKIIAVANSTLAGNHQIELVEKLHQEGYLLGFTTVQEFSNNCLAVKEWLSSQAGKVYPRRDSCLLNDLIFRQ